MKCVKCGAELPEGKLYCAECGEEIIMVPDFEAEVENQIDETMNQILDEIEEQEDTDQTRKEKKKHHWFLWLMIIVVVGICIVIYAVWFLLTSVEYRMQRGDYYSSQGDYHKAIEYYELIVEQDEENIPVLWKLTDSYNKLNNYEEYEACLHKLAESSYASEEDQFKAYESLISLYIEKKDYQKIDSLLNYCNNVRVVETYSYLLVSEPRFSHEAGFYKEIIPLKLYCDEGEKIYYTMDGSVPTTESHVYSGIIFLEGGEYEIKAVCVNKYGIVGKVITKEYQIEF